MVLSGLKMRHVLSLRGFRVSAYIIILTTTMENQMDKVMDNEMEVGLQQNVQGVYKSAQKKTPMELGIRQSVLRVYKSAKKP